MCYTLRMAQGSILKERIQMAENTYFLYDKIFKRILSLSARAVINLINGLFGTDYPTDSSITYNWTEFEDDSLQKTLADTIITVNGIHSYHMEAQMENDTDIVFRVLDYGFRHANRTRSTQQEPYLLRFPEPKVIYLYSETQIPEKYTVRLLFENQGSFDYEVSTVNLLTTSIQEINERKLVILIPFQLLKLRKLLSKTRTPETIQQLQNLIENDILGTIEKNLQLGNISAGDARLLMELTRRLLRHLYAGYAETEEVCAMYDHSLDLEMDKLLDRLAEKDEQLSEQRQQLSEKDAEIARLKAELAKHN